MHFRYEPWDGSEFPTQEHLRLFDNFMDYLIDYGEDALRALRDLAEDPEQAAIIDQWIEEGLLAKAGARFRLTPRAVHSMQRRALMEVFGRMRSGGMDGHETRQRGTGGEPIEETRPYAFGDPLSDIDLSSTLRNSLARRGTRVPIELDERDFALHAREARTSCSTVILLDMSGSMGRWNRFAQAKRCAMAMYAFIRQRYPLDSVDVVGFASGAEVIAEHKLPLAMPKRVTLFDPVVRHRVSISELSKAPQHFTNLQLGLMTARRILARRGGMNKQVFIITDGQPTAHVEGDLVYLTYPPTQQTAVASLSEALMLSKQGIRFATFALVEDYEDMEWVSFVDQMTRLTKGVAFYCSSNNLAECIMESFMSGRRTKTYLA